MHAEQTSPPQQFEFRAEIQQLLNILVHSLYTEREIFLRELVSNASDAINRFQFEQLTNPAVVDPDLPLEIHIDADTEGKTLTIRDTGIGMNRDELIENLGTIAHSGAATFLKALQEQQKSNSDIIGQFGVGFYSVFMVADEVTVTTRSYRTDDQAWTWTSRGDNSYTITPAEKTSRGTEITLKLKEDAADFAYNWKLESIVRRHSNYIPFPIHVGGTLSNAQKALWRRPKSEISAEEYTDFYKQLSYDEQPPLLHIHQSSDAPVQFYSLLYIPNKADRGLWTADSLDQGPKLYARKVLIQEAAKDLLPQWMRFTVGVVDSEDLPLNISRETIRSNSLMKSLQKVITGKVISELDGLATKDPEKYQLFWEQFGRLVKEGVAMDIANKDKLAKLLRFHSSTHPDQWVSLADYKGRMKDGQTEIYYLFGEDLKSIQRSPHLDIFRARELEVFFFTETVDSFMSGTLTEFDGATLRNGADPDLSLPPLPDEKEPEGEALSDDQIAVLLRDFKTLLGERVTEVRESKLLTASPVRLVAADKASGMDMERIAKMLDREFQTPKRILEVNRRHAIIRNVSDLNDAILRDDIFEQLYESALLLEGIHPNPADMVPRIEALMEAATRK
jgi:molecular chaperone HtpG